MCRKHLQQSKGAKSGGRNSIPEYKIKMRLEQARFERSQLVLEMQMKELETKHDLLREERELERKVKRTSLEIDDVRSQLFGAREKSPFNWIPTKRDVSDRVSGIDNLLISDRPTARFEVTPEMSRHSHLSRYRTIFSRPFIKCSRPRRFPQSWSTI